MGGECGCRRFEGVYGVGGYLAGGWVGDECHFFWVGRRGEIVVGEHLAKGMGVGGELGFFLVLLFYFFL